MRCRIQPDVWLPCVYREDNMKWPEAIAEASGWISFAVIVCFALSTCEGCVKARLDADRPTANKEAE